MTLFAALGIFLLLAGCESSKVAQAPEPPVHNAVTEYVGNGVTAMNKAQSVTEKANAQIQELNAHTQSAADSQ